MIGLRELTASLQAAGLDEWSETLIPLIESRFTTSTHGDFERWRATLLHLPEVSDSPAKLKQALLELAPWRKGPFDLGGVHIDAEWRSDLKWQRLKNALKPLAGRKVLDVGCGNGYYALRMHTEGAACVIGVDPTLLYAMQFLAVNHFVTAESVFVLPLRLQELPLPARRFDTCFSMGVLYHQRAPIDHIRALRDTLRPGGQLLLETLYLQGGDACARTPPDRYARMNNVWLLPTVAELETWLARSGFIDIEVVDTTVTSTEEQRRTEWMPFESLAEALDPGDPSRTLEGWPAPRRVIVTANAR